MAEPRFRNTAAAFLGALVGVNSTLAQSSAPGMERPIRPGNTPVTPQAPALGDPGLAPPAYNRFIRQEATLEGGPFFLGKNDYSQLSFKVKKAADLIRVTLLDATPFDANLLQQAVLGLKNLPLVGLRQDGIEIIRPGQGGPTVNGLRGVYTVRQTGSYEYIPYSDANRIQGVLNELIGKQEQYEQLLRLFSVRANPRSDNKLAQQAVEAVQDLKEELARTGIYRVPVGGLVSLPNSADPNPNFPIEARNTEEVRVSERVLQEIFGRYGAIVRTANEYMRNNDIRDNAQPLPAEPQPQQPAPQLDPLAKERYQNAYTEYKERYKNLTLAQLTSEMAEAQREVLKRIEVLIHNDSVPVLRRELGDNNLDPLYALVDFRNGKDLTPAQMNAAYSLLKNSRSASLDLVRAFKGANNEPTTVARMDVINLNIAAMRTKERQNEGK